MTESEEYLYSSAYTLIAGAGKINLNGYSEYIPGLQEYFIAQIIVQAFDFKLNVV